MSPELAYVQRRWHAAWAPPDRMPLPDWVEKCIWLSERSAPAPGPMKLWKTQRGILSAIGDRSVPFVTVMKGARTGYTKSIMGTIGHFAKNRPASVMLLVPTEDDARRFSCDEVTPMFQESPVLRGLLVNEGMGWAGGGDRDTLTYKNFSKGGTLKIISARSPRNLRSHDVKVLLLDEVDGYEITSEGDPVELAIKRTLAHDDRKIVMGSTPTIDGISIIQRRYDQSDQRVFEVPCPHCGEHWEILWEYLTWPADHPREAYLICPRCGKAIDESHKITMVEAGEWRATHPEVPDHAGFRMSALVSQFKNARWGLLAEEYVRAKKGGPAVMMVFENTVLGKTSKLSMDAVDENFLKSKSEDFSLVKLPRDVLLITCGVDVQHDRLEICLLGWSEFNQPYVLAYHIIHGSTIEQSTWKEFDTFLRQKWAHPHGYEIGIEATAVDSGGTGKGPESRTQAVYNFTDARTYRHIYAIKGTAGPRPIWKQSFSKKANAAKLFLVGVDQLKTECLERLAALPFMGEDGQPSAEDAKKGRNPMSFRISRTLPDGWFEQVSSERRYIRYVKNSPVIEFKPIHEGVRNEALDATVYAMAVRHSCNYVNMKMRAAKRGPGREPPVPVDNGLRGPRLTPQSTARTMASFGKLNS